MNAFTASWRFSAKYWNWSFNYLWPYLDSKLKCNFFDMIFDMHHNHIFWSFFQSFSGVQQSTSPTPLSLWRDSQTVQAYLGTSSTITKLPSPSSWANRTAASFALSQSYSSGQKSSQSQSNPNHPQDKEEIMELKRQLAHATQDLHLTKVNFPP